MLVAQGSSATWMDDWGAGDGGTRRWGSNNGVQASNSSVNAKRLNVSGSGVPRRVGPGGKERAFAAFEGVINRPLSSLESQALTAALAAFQNPNFGIPAINATSVGSPAGLQPNSNLNRTSVGLRKVGPNATTLVPNLQQNQVRQNGPVGKRPSHPWRSENVSQVELTARNVNAILNKLTFERFDSLFEQLLNSGIDANKETLERAIEQIFEKSLSEPQFSGLYTELCAKLNTRLNPVKAPDGTELSFRKLLLAKCRSLFVQKTKIEGASPAEEEALRSEMRKKVLGNATFVGELFKKSLISEKIMHQNVQLLLTDATKSNDEEAMESLAKLLTVVGKQLDRPEAKNWMDVYFQRIKELSDDVRITSRVRFVLVDVLEIRGNNWDSGREIEKPKKLDELHAEQDARMQQMGSRRVVIDNHTGYNNYSPNYSVLPKRDRQYGTVAHGSYGHYQSDHYTHSRGPHSYTLVPPPQKLSAEEMKSAAIAKVNSILVEWIMNGDQDELVSSLVHERGDLVVSRAAHLAIERKSADLPKLANSISILFANNRISYADAVDGLAEVFENLDKIEQDLDLPLTGQTIGSFTAYLAADGVVSIDLLNKVLPMTLPPKRPMIFISALRTLRELLGEEVMADVLSRVGLDIRICLVDPFSEEDALRVLKEEGLLKLLPGLGVRSGLVELLESDAPALLVEDLVRRTRPSGGPSGPELDEFAESVFEVILLNSVESAKASDKSGWGGVEERIGKLAKALCMACGKEVKNELMCAFIAQRIWYQEGSSNGLLDKLFRCLYKFDVVSGNAFEQWREDTENSTPGKIEALYQVNAFVVWVSEELAADEDEEEE